MAKHVTLSTENGKTLDNAGFSAVPSGTGIEKYKALFDSNMIGIAATDFDEKIFQANDAFLSIIGYTQEEVRNESLTWSKITPHKYEEADQDKLSELFKYKTIVPFEKEYLHKEGYAVPVLVGAEAANDSFTAGVSFALDISELKKLERKKDDFIGHVSHELRTPLSVMQLYTDYLKSSIESGADSKDLLDSIREIRTQIEKLNVLLSDLFNIAKYEAEESTMPVAAIDLSACVSEAVKEVTLLSKRNIVLEAKPKIYINGNKERMAQVVINLLNNALRYSSSDIIVRAYAKGDYAYVEVEDFGIGIREEDQQKIFERYYRIDHADDYAEEGAGIGLYISNEIVKNHRGKITVNSELGKGSKFTIQLPRIQ